MDKAYCLTLQISTIYGKSKNMLFSEHSNGIGLPRLRPLEVLRLVISSVGKHGASVFSCVKLSLRSCKRIWLATSASFLRFAASSFCSFEKICYAVDWYSIICFHLFQWPCKKGILWRTPIPRSTSFKISKTLLGWPSPACRQQVWQRAVFKTPFAWLIMNNCEGFYYSNLLNIYVCCIIHMYWYIYILYLYTYIYIYIYIYQENPKPQKRQGLYGKPCFPLKT